MVSNMSKICCGCKQEKDEGEFYHNSATKDRLTPYCIDCLKKKYDERKDFVESLKTKCIKCGDDRPWVIQFHHIDPSAKSFEISSGLTGRGKSAIQKETLKCACLCSNCHDEFHYFFGKNPTNPVEAFDLFLQDEY